MEPNADSITASTETSGVDYGRYTTYQTLKDLSDLNLDLRISLVDLAWGNLHGNYEFSGEEYLGTVSKIHAILISLLNPSRLLSISGDLSHDRPVIHLHII